MHENSTKCNEFLLTNSRVIFVSVNHFRLLKSWTNQWLSGTDSDCNDKTGFLLKKFNSFYFANFGLGLTTLCDFRINSMDFWIKPTINLSGFIFFSHRKYYPSENPCFDHQGMLQKSVVLRDWFVKGEKMICHLQTKNNLIPSKY